MVESNVERKNFDVEERVDYFTPQEDHFVQMCSTAKDRVCDMTCNNVFNTKDDSWYNDLDTSCIETKEASYTSTVISWSKGDG